MESITTISRNQRTVLEHFLLRKLFPKPVKRTVPVDELRKKLTGFAQQFEISRDLVQVLGYLLIRRHRLEAIAWLKGESLPETVVKKLQLSAVADRLINNEDSSREFVLELCRLIESILPSPLVICFDQIEAFQRHQGDFRGLFLFGQAISTIHDQTHNVLLVSCIQSFFLDPLKKAMTEADFARFSVHQCFMVPLTGKLALRLALARLKWAQENSDIHFPNEKYDEVKNHINSNLNAFVGGAGQTARAILAFCAEIYDSTTGNHPQEQMPSDSNEDENIEKIFQKREYQCLKMRLPDKTDDILQSALPLILPSLEMELLDNELDKLCDVDLIFKVGKQKTAVSICNQQDSLNLTYRLKRLLSQMQDGQFQHLAIIRHPSYPIRKTAKKAREYLSALKDKGADYLQPSPEILATLDAARQILADAKAGDLNVNGKNISHQTVKDWIISHLDDSVTEFLNRLKSGKADKKASYTDLMDDILEVLNMDKIVALDELIAAQLNTDTGVLTNTVRQNRNMVGYIEGSPPVIFQICPH